MSTGSHSWIAEFGLRPVGPTRRFDEIDIKILRLLSENARLRPQELCKSLGLGSTRAAQTRLRKLEEDGVILGYAAKLDERRLGQRLLAFVTVGFRPPDAESIEEMRQVLRDTEAIKESYLVAGGGDILLKIRTDSPDTLYRLVLGRLARINGVTSLRSTLVVGDLLQSIRAEAAPAH
jgi:Lrp/AsnC family transcriptional regulator, leucine-responsive regulatory protein